MLQFDFYAGPTSALLCLDHPFEVPFSWCPLFLLPESPGEKDQTLSEIILVLLNSHMQS